MRRALKITGIGCGGLVALIVVIAVIAAAVGHKSSPKKGAAAKTTTPTVTTPSIPKSVQEARAYISNHGPDINRVQANVLNVEIAIGEAVKSSTQANVNQLAEQAQTAHDNIDNIRDDFATDSSDPGELGNAELNAFSGANDLKNAMGALVAYTGDPNAATLAGFTTQFRRAKAEWNSGMRVIYRDARRKHPPTV
jgi:hypothetical protein